MIAISIARSDQAIRSAFAAAFAFAALAFVAFLTAGTFAAGTFTAGTFTAGTFTAGTFTAGTFAAGTFTAGTFTTGAFAAVTACQHVAGVQVRRVKGIFACHGGSRDGDGRNECNANSGCNGFNQVSFLSH
jgi:hypothetical protein